MAPPAQSLDNGTAYSQTDPSLFVHSEPKFNRTICDPYKQQPCKLPRQTRPLSSDRLRSRCGAAPAFAHPHAHSCPPLDDDDDDDDGGDDE
ncbi:hypothetical protein Zmor_024926 [Zophobas morio]|uniref:Uncharacterized protein n=1 Tax=Zophobas morio TaxID=2755281 RepID=A0AA38M4E0_9CUCU|nr:hypothetical protein Zmor_024926 [Zophobas morio]